MTTSSTEPREPVEQEGRFAFSLSTLLLVVTVLAVSLAVGRAWGWVTGVLLAWLCLCLLAIWRRRSGWALGSLLAWTMVVGGSLWGLNQSNRAASYSLGRLEDQYVEMYWSDSDQLERYAAVIFVGSRFESGETKFQEQYRTWSRELLTTAANIPFPPGEDVAVVNEAGEILYVTIPVECFVTEEHDVTLGGALPRLRDETFRRGLDRNKLEGTAVWREEIVPFLLGQEGAPEADSTIGP